MILEVASDDGRLLLEDDAADEAIRFRRLLGLRLGDGGGIDFPILFLYYESQVGLVTYSTVTVGQEMITKDWSERCSKRSVDRLLYSYRTTYWYDCYPRWLKSLDFRSATRAYTLTGLNPVTSQVD